jgi:hypothetical protein
MVANNDAIRQASRSMRSLVPAAKRWRGATGGRLVRCPEGSKALGRVQARQPGVGVPGAADAPGRNPTARTLAPRGRLGFKGQARPLTMGRRGARRLPDWGFNGQTLSGGDATGGAQRPPCQDCGTTPHILHVTMPLETGSLLSDRYRSELRPKAPSTLVASLTNDRIADRPSGRA